MIKIAVELVQESNLTGNPEIRLIIFEQDSDPVLQDTPWWTVKDIIAFELHAYDQFEATIGDLLAPGNFGEQCESITIVPQEPGVGRITIDMSSTSAHEPTEPYIYPVIKAVFQQWRGLVAPMVEAA